MLIANLCQYALGEDGDPRRRCARRRFSRIRGVTIRVEVSELRVISRRVATERTQRKLRSLPLTRPDIDEVDAFLKDRKAM